MHTNLISIVSFDSVYLSVVSSIIHRFVLG